MMNAESIEKALRGFVEQLEAGSPGVAEEAALLLGSLDRLLQPQADRSQRGSRHPRPPVYGADEFGRERVKATRRNVHSAVMALGKDNSITALNLFKQAVAEWTRHAAGTQQPS